MDIVVAKFREDVSWTNELTNKHRVFIYDKSGEPSTPYIPLPNRLREAGTYLHHIVEHYDDLAEYTMFLQGNPFDHCHLPRPQFIETLLNNPLALREDGHWHIHHGHGDGRPQHPGLPVEQMYMWLGYTQPRHQYKFRAGAQYLVSRDEIHKRDKEFYQRLYDFMQDHGGMCPWTIERLWIYIFNLE